MEADTTIKYDRLVEPKHKINKYKEVITLITPFVLILLGDYHHEG